MTALSEVCKTNREPLSKVLADVGLRKHGAVFLERLLFWWSKATTVHENHHWIWRHSLDEWAEEVGCSLGTIKWLINEFRDGDEPLIVTKRFLLRNKNGRPYGQPVLHIRLNHLIRIVRNRCGISIQQPGTGATGVAEGQTQECSTFGHKSIRRSATGVANATKGESKGVDKGDNVEPAHAHTHVHEEQTDQTDNPSPSTSEHSGGHDQVAPLDSGKPEALQEDIPKLEGGATNDEDSHPETAPSPPKAPLGSGADGEINCIALTGGGTKYVGLHDKHLLHPSEQPKNDMASEWANCPRRRSRLQRIHENALCVWYEEHFGPDNAFAKLKAQVAAEREAEKAKAEAELEAKQAARVAANKAKQQAEAAKIAAYVKRVHEARDAAWSKLPGVIQKKIRKDAAAVERAGADLIEYEKGTKPFEDLCVLAMLAIDQDKGIEEAHQLVKTLDDLWVGLFGKAA